jgi:hypothetical protein
MLDEPLAGKFRASLLTDGVYAIGSNGFDSIELIAVGARVDGFNDRPGRPVPVLGERVPHTAPVLLGADCPCVRVRDGGNPKEDVLERARARARNNRPDASIEMFVERLLLELATYLVAHRPSVGCGGCGDPRQDIVKRAEAVTWYDTPAWAGERDCGGLLPSTLN